MALKPGELITSIWGSYKIASFGSTFHCASSSSSSFLSFSLQLSQLAFTKRNIQALKISS